MKYIEEHDLQIAGPSLSRRAFLGGAAAAAAFAPSGCLPRRSGGDRLKVGVVSDVHILVQNDSMHGDIYFEKALRWFDARKADAVLLCGDIADCGLVAELEYAAEIWHRVFPGGKRSDGRSIEQLFHLGDHDLGGFAHKYPWAKSSSKDPDAPNHALVDEDVAAVWERLFHEKWAPIQVKKVKGYTFVLAHHPRNMASGTAIPGLAEALDAADDDPSRPLFVSMHRPVHGTLPEWDPKSLANDANHKALARHPNAIAFFGHAHRNCADDLNLWQGEYTALHVPSTSYCGTRGGRENSFSPGNKADKARPQQMDRVDCTSSNQALFMTVGDDRIEIERRDIRHDAPMGDNWTIPLPCPDGSCSAEERRPYSSAPEFPEGAAVAVSGRVGRNRAKEETAQVVVAFPPAHSRAGRPRAFDYEVAASAEGFKLVRRVFSSRAYWSEDFEKEPSSCVFARHELPLDRPVRFSVRPANSFGAHGGALLGTEWSARGGMRWYRGMLHMHTHWSDGRALPEQAVAAYKDAGYDFIAISDHNRFQDDPDRWIPVGDGTEKGWPPKAVHPDCFKAYVGRFGRGNVRERDGRTQVRLATYQELKKRFDEPEKFLLLPGVEITTDAKATGVTHAMHMNVIGIDDIIDRAKKAKLIEGCPKHTVSSIIRETREMSEALAKKRGRDCICMVNHPNWLYYDVFAKDLIDNPEVRYFEVCNNGSEWPVPDELDGEWYCDHLWDAVLAYRMTHGQQPLYGFGCDDSHFYPGTGLEFAAFGDAYIMVLSESLTQEALFAAIRAGRFYAASQLDLEDVLFDRETGTLTVSVPAIEGVACKIRFIATKKGARLDPVRYVDIPATAEHMNRSRKVPIYDERIGATVRLVEGKRGRRLEASYTLAADDLYVRARVETDAPTKFKRERCLHPAHHTAWTQPYAKEAE